MFKREKIEGFRVEVSICRKVLETIFDECDATDIDETGGRIVGYYHQSGDKLTIKACGLIGSGPNARRTPTSFFQDGEYQEKIFRQIEAEYPKIEHLGNWHTHHVNGLDTLSSGDIGTYERTVNHEKHNTDFFYALLVVAKNNTFYNRKRYLVKHFLLRRGESLVYEIPNAHVKIIKESPLFIDRAKVITGTSEKDTLTDSVTISQAAISHIRAKDKEFISEIYPEVKAFFSKKTNGLYWRGNIKLIDDTSVELLVLEAINESKPAYSIALTIPSAKLFQCHKIYLERSFDSAWKAIHLFERDLNREIFEKIKQ